MQNQEIKKWVPKFWKNAKLEEGRWGRYKNRNEAGKKVKESWDRDLSIGELKRVLGAQKSQKMSQCFWCEQHVWRPRVKESTLCWWKRAVAGCWWFAVGCWFGAVGCLLLTVWWWGGGSLFDGWVDCLLICFSSCLIAVNSSLVAFHSFCIAFHTASAQW